MLKRITRTAPYQLLGYLLVLTAGLAGVGVLQPGWTGTGRGQNDRTLLGSSVLLQPSSPAVKAAANRSAAKGQVVNQVLTGEMGLFAAAAWFGFFNEEVDGSVDDSWRDLPGGCDNEKLCRQVIHWVEGRVDAEGQPHLALVRRMQDELARHLAKHGRVILEEAE